MFILLKCLDSLSWLKAGALDLAEPDERGYSADDTKRPADHESKNSHDRAAWRYSKRGDHCSIEDIDVAHELAKPRKRAKASPIEQIIADAVKVACDYLVPQGFDAFVWKTLTPEERFYVKGLDIESHGELRAGAYQELARGFGVKEYQPLLASGKANQTRLKTASEFGTRLLGNGGFGVSPHSFGLLPPACLC